jgi:hypothetical protein
MTLIYSLPTNTNVASSQVRASVKEMIKKLSTDPQAGSMRRACAARCDSDHGGFAPPQRVCLCVGKKRAKYEGRIAKTVE